MTHVRPAYRGAIRNARDPEYMTLCGMWVSWLVHHRTAP